MSVGLDPAVIRMINVSKSLYSMRKAFSVRLYMQLAAYALQSLLLIGENESHDLDNTLLFNNLLKVFDKNFDKNCLTAQYCSGNNRRL